MIRSKLAVFDTLEEAQQSNLSKNQVFIVLGNESVDDGMADFYYTAAEGGLSNLGPWTIEKLNSNFSGTSSVVPVSSPYDLKGGELDSTKVYRIDGIIDFTGTGISIEVPTNGITLLGYGANISGLICSDDNYSLFVDAPGGCGDLIQNKVTIAITGTNSQVYSNTSKDGLSLFSVEDLFFQDCTSLGYLDSFFQGLESVVTRRGGTPELEFRGVWGAGYLMDTVNGFGMVDGSYTIFKAGSGFTMGSRFKTNVNINLPATPSFFDFSAANFPTPSSLQIQDTIVTRNGVFDPTDATLTPNISHTELSFIMG